MTTTAIQLKENDVFSFRYNEEYVKKSYLSPYHCFDGTLIVRKRDDGSLYLKDTYWGNSESRTFTPEQALERGVLKFICNLDEVEKVDKHSQKYYNDDDFITLYQHAGYQNTYYIKKGAEKSKEKMIESIRQKIEEEESSIRSSQWQIECLQKSLDKVNSGDTNIYF